jgi:phospholipid/cholesterol/gamma-HCH transport system substrate-binding protein
MNPDPVKSVAKTNGQAKNGNSHGALSPVEVSAGGADAAGASAERRADVKVGAFVLLILVMAVAMTLVLAQKRHVFEHRVVVHAVFQEVQGLKEGAPVRLSGVNIGQVSRLAFAKEKTASLIHVDMEISRESLERIGIDSVARIGSQGLLGDKIIELSVSSNPDQAISAGATLESQPPADFNKLVEQASDVLAKAKIVADRAAIFMEGVSDPRSLENVRGIVRSANVLVSRVEKGPGLMHALFYDPESTRTFNSLLARVNTLSGHVDEAVLHVDALLGTTDEDGAQLVNNLSRAARSFGDVADQVRQSKVIPHLDQASGDLAAMTAYARSGHGTIGLALMDPTVYEQMITVLGGVARSRVLRALVRYAILNDDGQKAGQAVDTPAVKGLVLPPAAEALPAGTR